MSTKQVLVVSPPNVVKPPEGIQSQGIDIETIKARKNRALSSRRGRFRPTTLEEEKIETPSVDEKVKEINAPGVEEEKITEKPNFISLPVNGKRYVVSRENLVRPSNIRVVSPPRSEEVKEEIKTPTGVEEVKEEVRPKVFSLPIHGKRQVFTPNNLVRPYTPRTMQVRPPPKVEVVETPTKSEEIVRTPNKVEEVVKERPGIRSRFAPSLSQYIATRRERSRALIFSPFLRRREDLRRRIEQRSVFSPRQEEEVYVSQRREYAPTIYGRQAPTFISSRDYDYEPYQYTAQKVAQAQALTTVNTQEPLLVFDDLPNPQEETVVNKYAPYDEDDYEIDISPASILNFNAKRTPPSSSNVIINTPARKKEDRSKTSIEIQNKKAIQSLFRYGF